MPVEELIGLAEEPRRAKRKSLRRSAIIVHKLVRKVLVKFGTKRSQVEGEPAYCAVTRRDQARQWFDIEHMKRSTNR